MKPAWIVLGIAAAVVLLAVIVVFWRRRVAEPEAEATAEERAEGAVAERKERPAPESRETAEPSRATAPREAKPPDTAEAAEAEAAEAEPVAPEPAPEEVRERVESLVEDSERMLAELRELQGEPETAGETESVEIMQDGLREVRNLARKEQWGQAKDKGEALYAQVSLMLQNARRERTSS